MSDTGRESPSQGKAPSPLSRHYRTVLTRTIKDAAAICSQAAVIEADVKLRNHHEIAEEKRSWAGWSIKPLEQYRKTIVSTTEKWNEAIKALDDEQIKLEETNYQDRYFREKVLSAFHVDREDEEEEETESTPLDSFLIDIDYYLDKLRLYSDNVHSSPADSSRHSELSREDAEAITRSIQPLSTPSKTPPLLPATTIHAPAESATSGTNGEKTGGAKFGANPWEEEKRKEKESLLSAVKGLNTATDTGEDKGPRQPVPLQPPNHPHSPVDDKQHESTGGVMGWKGKREGDGPLAGKRDRVQNHEEIQSIVANILANGGAIPQAQNQHIPPPIAYSPLASPALQLPSMPLPSFDGREPWTFSSFLSTFEAIVVPGALTDFQRLHYLRSCLQGEALDAIAPILPGEGSYATARERLAEIYKGDPQQTSALIRQKIQGINRLPEGCGSEAELKAIRNSRALVEQLIASESDSAFLTDAIVASLPERVIKKAIKFRIENRSIGTVQLLEKLETASIKDITVERLTAGAKKCPGLKKAENVRYASDDLESSNEVGTEETREDPSLLVSLPPVSVIDLNKGKCALCGKHPSGQEEHCRQYPTVDERTARCRMLRLCFRCLHGGNGHVYKRCEAVCHHCNGHHHRSLCKRITKSRNKVLACVEDSPPDNDYYDVMEAERDQEEAKERVLAVHEIVGIATVAPLPIVPRIPSSKLLTFQGLLVHPTTGQEHPINIMLDPGASVSLISNRVASILRMQALGAAETAFMGVGGMQTSEFKQHPVYSFKLKSVVKDSSSMEIVAYELAAPLTGPERVFDLSSKDRQFIRKARLESALLADSDGPPDVLVGQDESAECMDTGQRIVRLPSGMKLQPSIFGYIRSGFAREQKKESVQCMMLPESVRTILDIDTTMSSNTQWIEQETKATVSHCSDSQKTDYSSGNGSSIRLLSTAPSKLSPLRSLTIMCCLLTMVFSLGVAAEMAQTVKCLPHGITINSTAGYGMQVCSPTECYVITPEDNTGSVTVQFPPSISAAPFETFVKVVTENTTFISRKTCPSSDVCANMRDDWSFDHLIVPQCHPWMVIALVCSLIYTTSLTIALFVYMTCFRRVTGAEVLHAICKCHCRSIRGVARLACLVWKGMCLPFGWLRRPRRARSDERRRARMEATALLTMAIITVIISVPLARGCQHAVLMTENVEKCQEERCSIEKGIELTTDAVSKTACISLTRDGDDRVRGAISVEVLENQLVCTKHVLGLHREAEVHVSSSKRCFKAGSCDGERCENMKGDDHLDEFDHIEHLPGHTHCVESCGGWECGCLSFHSACLFYRTYLLPTSSRIYESSRCSAWSSRAVLRINTTIGTIVSSSNITLSEGEFSHQLKEEGIKMIRMDEIEKPEYNALLQRVFLDDGVRMAAVTEFSANNICENEEAARDFKCEARERCVCQPVTKKVRCDCDESTIEGRFTLEDTLPIRLPSMEIAADTNTLAPIMHLRRGSLRLYLVLSEDVHNARLEEQEMECKITASPVRGCYGCEQGAEVFFKCETAENSEVLISCEGNAVRIPCSKGGLKSKRRLHFDHSEVKARCPTSCTGKEIEIAGSLSTPPHLAPSSAIRSVQGGVVPRWEIFPDLGPLIKTLTDHWKTALLALMITCGILALTAVVIIGGPASLWLFIPSILRRRRNQRRAHAKTV